MNLPSTSFLGMGFGFAANVRPEQLKGLFMLPFAGAVALFVALFPWRVAVARAVHESNNGRLKVLALAPWLVVAVVLGLGWFFLPFGALVWGLGMLLCVHPSPFGGFWRDPIAQSGAALALCAALIVAARVFRL